MQRLTLDTFTAQQRIAAVEALQVSSDLGREAKITTHVLLRAFDAERKGIEVLHTDLFDSSAEVVLSALATLGALKEQRSIKHVARLLTQPDEALQCAAVRTIGDIRYLGAVKMLLDLFNISKGEDLRCAILEALAAISPEDERVRNLIQECFASTLFPAQLRAAAVRLMLRLEIGELNIVDLLTGAKEPITETVLTCTERDGRIRTQALRYGAANYGRLSPANRSRIISLASPYSTPDALQILREAMVDPDSVVRHTAYRELGRSLNQTPGLTIIVHHLCEQVDPDPSVEEEAWSAIERMERASTGDVALGEDVTKKIYAHIQDGFNTLSTADRTVGSDSHELGWLISRSKEYLEYYADEDFRQALLHFLKGSSCYTRDQILAGLKATAVKVEVRHFDGYRALTDIIKTPQRAGIGLIARELAIAKLGKRRILYRLIRNLRLSRLTEPAGERADAAQLFLQIFSWARQAQLYRLAEGALYALAKVDRDKASSSSSDCLAPPVFSKICAIAAIRLLKELDCRVMKPAVIALLSSTDDSHILLNLVDSIETAAVPDGGEITTGMVNILLTGDDQEVVRRIADFLGARFSLSVFESVADMYEHLEPWRQGLILSLLERGILENRVTEHEGLVEFLYRILRTDGGPYRSKAALLLWRLGDDYAPKLLMEFLSSKEAEEKTAILRGLHAALSSEIVPALLPLLKSDHSGIQEALREVLLSAEDEETRKAVCELTLAARGQGSLGSDQLQSSEEVEVQLDLYKEKKTYRFEREFVQELAILFTDIQGYSRKAQALSTLQLSALIQEYEGILLPTVAGHRGELIKKMGDGHLFVFSVALDAVLAAIRVQKALKRFNSYREENQRVVVRIGIHWGKVVCKEGDVLGNHVNIASRLESSARGGSILISEALNRQLGEHVHLRDVGLINVKGISEPVKVYEPYEIALGLPAELDPLCRTAVAQRQFEMAAGAAAGSKVSCSDRGDGTAPALKPAAVGYISAAFSSLNKLCLKAEAQETDTAEIRKELLRHWRILRSVLIQGR